MDLFINWSKEVATVYGPPFLTGILTLLVGWMVAKPIAGAVRRILRSARVDATLTLFVANLVYVTLLTLVVITALDRFGFPAVSFAAVIGAAGLAIGLALKGTLSNFAAGMVLIALRPFNVGDRIQAAGVEGVVARVNVFATTLRAADERMIIVPNASITGGTITTFPPAR